MTERTVLTWRDVESCAAVARSRIPDGVALYGVPRGGAMAALAIRRIGAMRLVSTPEEADVIVDDIIDSGVTKQRYNGRFPDKPFVVLVDKRNRKDSDWIVFPWETDEQDGPEENIRRLLEFVGDDPNREGLRETPARVIRSYGEIFSGYKIDPASVFKVFEEGACDEMVLVRNVEFFSVCEHHMQPFFGQAHLAYVPNGKVIGVSKLVRLLEVFTRRLQIQERICQQVTAALDEYLKPLGSACILEAKHFCMTCRGVNKQGSEMVTSSLTGVFRDKAPARQELLSLIRG